SRTSTRGTAAIATARGSSPGRRRRTWRCATRPASDGPPRAIPATPTSTTTPAAESRGTVASGSSPRACAPVSAATPRRPPAWPITGAATSGSRRVPPSGGRCRRDSPPWPGRSSWISPRRGSIAPTPCTPCGSDWNGEARPMNTATRGAGERIERPDGKERDMRLIPWFVSVGLCWAGATAANVLSGRVTDTSGSGVHPVDIDVYLSSNNTLVNTPDDTTNAQGFYSIQLPAGPYNVVFKPTASSHLFKKTVNFVNVNTNVTLN